MYPQFFGFQKLPFRLRPDPDFLYSGREYRKARDTVLAAIRGASRIILVTGQPGVGKTLLLDDVLAAVACEVAACRINQPHISPTELLQALILQLGTDPPVEGQANPPQLFTELSAALEAAGNRKAPPMVIIDDAQLVTGATLAALDEVLTRAPHLKLLLVGQNAPAHNGAGLAARFTKAAKPRQVQLAPLGEGETKAYIEHRITVAGGTGKELFTADAHAMIFQHTAGAPRLINVLCDAALHAACLRASGHVSSSEILAATQDSRWPEALAREKPRPAPPPLDAPPDLTTVVKPQPPPEAASVARPAPPQPRTPGGQLFVAHRDLHVATLPLPEGRISIGRASDNSLRLDEPYISRHHCRIVTNANISIIEDLDSVNGVSVNGRLVKRHVLKNSDQIKLGEHTFTYIIG